jgi:hypothetical protein
MTAYTIATIIRKLEVERGALKTEVVRLRAVIEMVEWAPDSDEAYCPWCMADHYEGHRVDCPRQAALQDAL